MSVFFSLLVLLRRKKWTVFVSYINLKTKKNINVPLESISWVECQFCPLIKSVLYICLGEESNCSLSYYSNQNFLLFIFIEIFKRKNYKYWYSPWLPKESSLIQCPKVSAVIIAMTVTNQKNNCK
jgi:hypothetical protein